MPTTVRRSLLIAAALVPVVALIALPLSCRSQVRVAPDWTPRRLRDELERAGVVYEGKEMARAPGIDPGYYLRRPGDKRPWAELASQSRMVPERMKGYVVVAILPRALTPDGEPVPGRACLGHFQLIGDPIEVERILAAVH